MSDVQWLANAPLPDARVGELGYAPMDTIHAELDELLLRAQKAGTPNWVPLLSEIDAHLRSHFEVEDRWMRETDFPPRDCHLAEHAAVLRTSAEVLQLAKIGQVESAPVFVSELIRWFPGHANYLDSALAIWMCKRQFGGQPVVLRRQTRPRPPSDAVEFF